MTDTQGKTIEALEKEISETEAQLQDVHGTECEVYARIVGYYRAVKNWNKGKKEEYSMRAMFNTDNAAAHIARKSAGTASSASLETAIGASNNKSKTNNTKEHFELYFRETCPNCPAVESYMQGVNMAGRSINVDTDAGLKEAAAKGVFAAPTVIFYNEAGQETARCHTTAELEDVVSRAA